MPKISVIIPTHNAQAYIAEAIESIQAQTCSDWELIIVNDGSTDQTLAITESYAQQDKRLKVITQANQGEARARLTGFIASQAERIYFLDADDLSYPQTLQRLSASLDQCPQAIAAYGLTTLIDQTGQAILTRVPVAVANVPLNVLGPLLERGFINMGAVCMRSVYLSPDDFATNLILGSDQRMLCRVAARGPFVFIGGDPVLAYRQHEHSQLHRFQADLKKSLALSQVLFADPLIRDQLSAWHLLQCRQMRLFFTYYYAFRLSLRQKAYQTASFYFWCWVKMLIHQLHLRRRLSQLVLNRPAPNPKGAPMLDEIYTGERGYLLSKIRLPQ